jgi:hypothetical protein
MNITVKPPVVETKIVEVSPAKVQLELTMEEAWFLVVILGRVAYSLDTLGLYSTMYTRIVRSNPAAVRATDALSNTMDGSIYLRKS